MNKENNIKPYFEKDDKMRYITIMILFFSYFFLSSNGNWNSFIFEVSNNFLKAFGMLLLVGYVSHLFSTRKENNFSSIFLALSAIAVLTSVVFKL